MIRRVAVLRVCTFMVALLALTAADVAARTISLAWDASADPVAGYRVYWSTQSGSFSETEYFDVGNSLEWTGDLPGDQHYFVVRAYDEEGTLGPLSLEVGDTTAFWLTNPGDQLSDIGQVIDLPLIAHGASVTYGAEALPAALEIDPISGRIVGTIAAPDTFPATHVVTARAVDANGRVSSVQFYWTIRSNSPPIVTDQQDLTNLGGDAVELPIFAVDLDGGTLAYSASNLPPGLTIHSTSGIISGTVSATAAGLFNVSVAVSDGVFVSNVAFAWRIWPGDALTIDQVISAEDIGSSVTTAAFSTTVAGEILMAFVQAAQPTTDGAQTTVVSGAGLEWSLVARGNAQPGTSDIWLARAPARLTDVAVSAESSIGGTFLSLTVVAFAGADGVGASATASAETGAPAVSLTTTRAGSFVFGAGNDWTGPLPRTLPAGQELVHEALNEGGDTMWVQRISGAVAAAGTPVTVNAIEPTDHRFNIAAVEIRARVRAVPPTIVLSPELAAPGSTLIASINNAPGNPADRAGLFSVTGDSTEILAWQYLNGSTTLPETGFTSAELSFVAPLEPGHYNVRLFAASDPTVAIAVSNATLVPVGVSINDVSIAEGNAGSSSMVLTVTLSAPSVVPVSVNYATADGTATAGSDYTAQSGTLVFAPGITQQTIAVAIHGDTIVESGESFSVVLSGAVNAIIDDAQGLGTISNDDVVAPEPPVKGAMFGFGALADGPVRNLFVFRVADGKDKDKGKGKGHDYSRLEFWSSEPIKGKGKDKGTDKHVDDDDRGGRDEGDYRRDHRAAKNRFEATTISSVAFGPFDKKTGSVTFSGAGEWNGKSGFTFEVSAADLGEPGRGRDTFALIVKDKRGTVVLNVSGTLDKGNIQATQHTKR